MVHVQSVIMVEVACWKSWHPKAEVHTNACHGKSGSRKTYRRMQSTVVSSDHWPTARLGSGRLHSTSRNSVLSRAHNRRRGESVSSCRHSKSSAKQLNVGTEYDI